MRSGEYWTDAAVAALKANLPAVLASIDADEGDFTLPVPTGDDYYPGGVTQAEAYPTVEVACPDWQLTNMPLGQAYAEHEFTIVVRVWLSDQTIDEQQWTRESLYRAVNRYGEALFAVLARPGILDGQHVELTNVRGQHRFSPADDTRPVNETYVMMWFDYASSEGRER